MHLISLLFSCCVVFVGGSLTAPTIDKALAEQSVLLSYASYCGVNIDEDFDCYWCKKVKNFAWVGDFGYVNGPGFGFVGYDNSTLPHKTFLVFRGSNDLPGWINDGEFVQTHLPWASSTDVEVHQGFLLIFQNISSAIVGLLKSVRFNCPTCSDLVVTGHSLGGALAVVGASYLAAAFPGQQIELINFGAPRVGDDDFANWFKALSNVQYARYTFARDPVPHLPARTVLKQGYHHAAWELFSKAAGQPYDACDGSGEDVKCCDQFKAGSYDPLDHATYLGVDLMQGVVHGCPASLPGPAVVLAKE